MTKVIVLVAPAAIDVVVTDSIVAAPWVIAVIANASPSAVYGLSAAHSMIESVTSVTTSQVMASAVLVLLPPQTTVSPASPNAVAIPAGPHVAVAGVVAPVVQQRWPIAAERVTVMG